MKSGTLSRRLLQTFLLQGVAISLATILGIALAGYILENFLVFEALKRESDFFWKKFSVDPSFQLPATFNLTGYFLDEKMPADLPAALYGLENGFHKNTGVEGYSFVFLSENAGQRLLLVFDNEQVSTLATWFGVVPLVVVLMVLYLTIWGAFRFTKQAVSPIVRLADRVNSLKIDEPGATFAIEQDATGTNDEVVILEKALSDLVARVQSLVERERMFTRDASHELRTPLTVIGIAADVLSARNDLPASALKNIDRIRRSVQDMQELVQALLILARETDQKLPLDSVSINHLVHREIDQLKILIDDKPVEFVVQNTDELRLSTNEQVVSMLLGNLLRNALHYTDQGQILVEIDSRKVVIADSGVGMTEDDKSRAFDLYFKGGKRGGHGIGLSIVKRFSDHFGWPVDVESQPGKGTRVSIQFRN